MSEATMSTETQNTYARWYEKNKKDLSDKRKERYKNDPEYRQKCLDRKAKQSKDKQAAPVPDKYTTNFTQAAAKLGVSLWTLRRWKEADYFPEPYTHTQGRFFTDSQVSLLNKLVDFFEDKGKAHRAGDEAAATELQNLADLIRANWEY